MHQHTKGFAGHFNRGEAIGERGGKWQWQRLVVVARGVAAITQVLDDHPRFFIVVNGLALGVVQRHLLAVEQHGHLAQGGVLLFVGFLERRDEGKYTGQQRHQQNRQGQRHRQAQLHRLTQTFLKPSIPCP